jgi:hypothetical protein
MKIVKQQAVAKLDLTCECAHLCAVPCQPYRSVTALFGVHRLWLGKRWAGRWDSRAPSGTKPPWLL